MLVSGRAVGLFEQHLCGGLAELILGLGGDVVYIVSKNSVVAGPSNVAYGAAKADQAHQVRLLAAELGPFGIRVNGINPDGVVRGSGIFAGGWGAQRAAVYGVPESELGAFYAKRALLGPKGRSRCWGWRRELSQLRWWPEDRSWPGRWREAISKMTVHEFSFPAFRRCDQ